MNLYAFGFTLPLVFALLPLISLGTPYALLGALLSYSIFTVLELCLPPALGNAHDERAVAASPWYKLVLWLYVPAQCFVFAYALQLAPRMSAFELFGAMLALPLVTGSLGITFAHELGHHRSRFDKALAHLLMASVGYGHFMVEHYRGHHLRVATLSDPATARRGESIYRFWLRTIPGQWQSAWQLERERLQGKPFTLRNIVLLHNLIAFAIPLLLWATLGFKAALLWIGVAVYSILLLESVNYIEHYGILRACDAEGVPEPVNQQHAWNTYAQPTNWLLVHLQRHSDHHMFQGRPYALLRAVRPAHELPTGYSGSILLALFPKLWFKTMHRRLDA